MTVVFPHLGLIGRLGNALFQFAATYGVARAEDTDPCFNADWIHRPYFSVPDKFFHPDPRGVQVDAFLSHIDPRTRVYMQDVQLFEKYLPEIRCFLKPSVLAQERLEQCTDFWRLRQPILSIHVRRGDNVPGQDPGVPNKEDYYVLPATNYYKLAAYELLDGINSVAVFSDEPEWCAENFPWADYVHRGVPRPKEHEPDFRTAPVLDWIDLQLMANCQRHVVTGSTFGIWGALLADSEAVIRPTPVYGPLLPYVNEDSLFPSDWKVLPACS